MNDSIIDILNDVLCENYTQENINSQHIQFKVLPKWDSLAHLSIMSELEDKFNLDISIEDMQELTNYAKIKEFVEKY